MDRRNLLKSFGALVIFPKRKKVNLRKIKMMTLNHMESALSTAEGYYFTKDTLKKYLKDPVFGITSLEDEDGNVLKINDLNRTLVLLKLELTK